MPADKIKIGVPPFLNTKPLVHDLGSEIITQGFEVSEHPPSGLCEIMLNGEVDISLLPAADIFSHPGFRVFRDVCISSFGKVSSVVVFSTKPLEEIKTVAVDSGSSSSAMMLRVILELFNGVKPAYKKREYGGRFFTEVDAGLVIGNAGLELSTSPPEGFPLCFDLGEIWTEITGLPFVYAVFAARPGFNPARAVQALISSKNRGMKMLPEIAQTQRPSPKLSEKICRDYLENKIRYNLGPEEIEGLLKFGLLISKLGEREQNPKRQTAGEIKVNFYP